MTNKKERIVTILGEQIKVRFNMAVEIAFEKISGELFTIKALESAKNTIMLYAAIIVANNPDSNIDLNRLITEVPIHEIQSMREAVIDAMVESCLNDEEMEKYKAAKKELEAGMEPRLD